MQNRPEMERREADLLAPYASKNGSSRGRQHLEESHAYRTDYMRDRDRIIHCTAFRRLEYKTQVFVYHEGDHYRTRLTHTIEVAQIARTIARALNINEDLCEAIALSHDLGHPPFGHSGERALDELMTDYGGFEHNGHALRVVDHIEHRYPAFRGLNLTWEIREAIAKHSKRRDDPILSPFMITEQPCVEAQVVDVADSIAYNSHDLDDGLESGLLTFDMLSEAPLWRKMYALTTSSMGLSTKLVKYKVIRKLINAQVGDVIRQTENNLRRLSIESPDQARNQEEPVVDFSVDMRREHRGLKEFLLQHMYQSHRVVRMEVKAYRVIQELFGAYNSRPELLPPSVMSNIDREGKQRLICDYIAGMTDRFALEEHQKLFDPLSKV